MFTVTLQDITKNINLSIYCRNYVHCFTIFTNLININHSYTHIVNIDNCENSYNKLIYFRFTVFADA